MLSRTTELRWVKRARVPVPAAPADAARPVPLPTPRERLVAALAERPRTVAQLAQAFGLAPPTMLEQVRRALRDGLIVEVEVDQAEKRFAAERYYAPAVPVIRQPDRELLQSACRGLAEEVAATLARNRGDLEAAFALTHLAREGWAFAALWLYLRDMIDRLVAERVEGFVGSGAAAPHGLAWMEEVAEPAIAPPRREEGVA